MTAWVIKKNIDGQPTRYLSFAMLAPSWIDCEFLAGAFFSYQSAYAFLESKNLHWVSYIRIEQETRDLIGFQSPFANG
jgi:hypothetical protein